MSIHLGPQIGVSFAEVGEPRLKQVVELWNVIARDQRKNLASNLFVVVVVVETTMAVSQLGAQMVVSCPEAGQPLVT